jgi:hypothetical protein
MAGFTYRFDIRFYRQYNEIGFAGQSHGGLPGCRTPRKRMAMMSDAAGKRRWTPRLVLRWCGMIALVIALLMALFGAYGFDPRVSPKLFFVYWTVFFILLVGAILVAVLDALATIIKFRQEHMKLRKRIRNELHTNEDTGSFLT